jgi:hypothetical protein
MKGSGMGACFRWRPWRARWSGSSGGVGCEEEKRSTLNRDASLVTSWWQQRYRRGTAAASVGTCTPGRGTDRRSARCAARMVRGDAWGDIKTRRLGALRQGRCATGVACGRGRWGDRHTGAACGPARNIVAWPALWPKRFKLGDFENDFLPKIVLKCTKQWTEKL